MVNYSVYWPLISQLYYIVIFWYLFTLSPLRVTPQSRVGGFEFSNLIIIIAIFKNPLVVEEEEDQHKKSFNFKILKNPRFILLMLGKLRKILKIEAFI